MPKKDFTKIGSILLNKYNYSFVYWFDLLKQCYIFKWVYIESLVLSVSLMYSSYLPVFRDILARIIPMCVNTCVSQECWSMMNVIQLVLYRADYARLMSLSVPNICIASIDALLPTMRGVRVKLNGLHTSQDYRLKRVSHSQ